MQLLINHLTRMHGGYICVAGIDLETRRHVRPVLANEPLPFYLLARYGGAFDMGRVVDLGTPRPMPQPPHVEDHVFVSACVRLRRKVLGDEFWNCLEQLQQSRLREIFGSVLCEISRWHWATPLGQGAASLGLIRPLKLPKVYLATRRDGRQQVRIRFTDGELQVDAGVTDLRLYGDDHATPNASAIHTVEESLSEAQGVILGIGLTRKFRVSEGDEYYHWLQVTNIHLRANSVWALD